MRKPVLLFITRKWEGYGGMQRLSQDLWRGMQETYGERVRLCTFVGRAVVLGIIAVWRGGHVHLLDAALAPLGWFLKKVGRGRVTVTACGLDVVWPQWWYQWLLRRTLPCLDRIVCISQATAEEVRKRGVDLWRVRIIPCGVWPVERGTGQLSLARRIRTASVCAPCCPVPLLLTVGRLVPRKGVVWFVREVVPLILRDFPQLQYWIVGRGPEELLIKKCIQEKGLENCVHMLGELDDVGREECFTQADFLVVPNIHLPGDVEGFGIACIEASARGIPVVAARCDGLSDAVMEGETGRFFTSGDADDCARVLCEVFGGTWDRGRVTRATLAHYGWPRLFQRYRDEVFGFG